MPATDQCTFDFWSKHYVGNIYVAVTHWLSTYSDMEGTPLYAQMKEIQAKAKEAYPE